MRRLWLDFRRAPPASLTGYGLLAVGILAAGLVVAAQLLLHREIARYSALAARTSASDAGAARQPLPIQAKSEKEALDNARLVVEHLTVPWDRLFAALEGIQEKDVAVLAITPNVQKRQIRIFAEAKTLSAMLAYHRRLQDTHLFTDVALTEHEVQLQDPEKPVRFNLIATWTL
jgi:hypothetical protein